MYINRAKVREFHFQIDNLFGCSGKPFSCDVEIRHADQITVLPIEIQYHCGLFEGIAFDKMTYYFTVFCRLLSTHMIDEQAEKQDR